MKRPRLWKIDSATFKKFWLMYIDFKKHAKKEDVIPCFDHRANTDGACEKSDVCDWNAYDATNATNGTLATRFVSQAKSTTNYNVLSIACIF